MYVTIILLFPILGLLNQQRLYFLSFAEGAAVMAAEICGARLIAPFFGSSLYVWSAVMAITLGGLAAGYFMGGRLSTRPNKAVLLQRVILCSIVWLLLMPLLPGLFYLIASHLSLIPAVILGVLVLLFPAMLCMGAASPLVIACLTNEAVQSGANSGRVYAVSTTGGILATFLCGFWLVPAYGLMITLTCFAAVLTLALVLFSWKVRAYKGLPLLLLPLILAVYGFIKAPRHPSSLYEAEGILGRLEVFEEPSPSSPQTMVRKLAINRIVQTEMDVNTHRSVSAYAKLLEDNLEHCPRGKALVLGLGGGIVSNMLQAHGYAVTAVEFDSRIIEAARTFFYLDPSVTAVADDARHYLNGSSEKFNLVLFDIFKAEEQPSHVLTLESLQKLKAQLYPGGVVVINTHGYLAGDKGKGTQCLLATLSKAGFHLKVCSKSHDEDYRNLLIYASPDPFNTALGQEISFELNDTALVNSDLKPVLEKLNAPANQAWRAHYIRNYILYR